MVRNVYVGFCRTDVVADSFAVCNIRDKDRVIVVCKIREEDRFIAVCNIREKDRFIAVCNITERERYRDTEIHHDGQIQLTHFYYTAL